MWNVKNDNCFHSSLGLKIMLKKFFFPEKDLLCSEVLCPSVQLVFADAVIKDSFSALKITVVFRRCFTFKVKIL